MSRSSIRSVPLITLLSCASAVAADPAPPLALVKTIALTGVDGKLDHLEVDPAGRRLFVANKPNNTLDVVDLTTGMTVRQVAGQGKVSGVAYAPDSDTVFVGNGSGTCNAFDCRDYSVRFSAKAAGADNVHYHAKANALYVAHGETLTALDAKTGDAKGAVKLPGSAHGFSLDEATGTAYVVLTKPSVIAVVDLAKGAVARTFPLTRADAGSPIARDAATGVLFVGCPKTPKVVVFDVKTGAELAAVDIPGGVDDVQFDPARGRLYASCGDGALVVIEKAAGGYALTARLDTPKGARTCALGGDGRVYLGVPKQPGAAGPEVRVYEPRP